MNINHVFVVGDMVVFIPSVLLLVQAIPGIFSGIVPRFHCPAGINSWVICSRVPRYLPTRLWYYCRMVFPDRAMRAIFRHGRPIFTMAEIPKGHAKNDAEDLGESAPNIPDLFSVTRFNGKYTSKPQRSVA